MKLTRPTPLTNLLLLFAVAGAPLTFAGMHVTGIGFNLWRCNAAGEQHPIPLDLWTAILTGVTAPIALAAWVTATVIFFRTRGVGNAPPAGRIHYLAAMGMALSPLFLFMILMSGLGTIALPTCHQS